jgi:hypothetical protein
VFRGWLVAANLGSGWHGRHAEALQCWAGWKSSIGLPEGS